MCFIVFRSISVGNVQEFEVRSSKVRKSLTKKAFGGLQTARLYSIIDYPCVMQNQMPLLLADPDKPAVKIPLPNAADSLRPLVKSSTSRTHATLSTPQTGIQHSRKLVPLCLRPGVKTRGTLGACTLCSRGGSVRASPFSLFILSPAAELHIVI